MFRKLSLAVFAVSVSTPAMASETISYTYDALGRLTSMSEAGSVNNGVTSTASFDPAGNRKSYTVGGTVVPEISVADSSATEGGSLTFTVTLSAAPSSPVSVEYATSDGSASAGSDYTAISGTLSFAVGETSKTITVSTIDDTVTESSETFTLNLSSPSGGTLNRASATGTIIDNDQALMAATNPTLSYSSAASYSIAITSLVTLNGHSAKVTAFTVPSGKGTAAIASDGQSITYTAETIKTPGLCESAITDVFSVPYTIQDVSGATSVSGTASLHVTGAPGRQATGNQECP